MSYRSLFAKFKRAPTLVEKQQILPELVQTLVTKTRYSDFLGEVERVLDEVERGGQGLVGLLIQYGICPVYDSNLYYISFKPILDKMFPNPEGLSSRSIWYAPKSKFGPGATMQSWLPFDRSVYTHEMLLADALYQKIALHRPKNLAPMLRVAFYDTRALLLILQGLNRVSSTTNLSFDLAISEATFVSNKNNDRAVAHLSCCGVRHASASETLDITIDLDHWKRVTQAWKGVSISASFLELFYREGVWQVWFYMESVTTLLTGHLKHVAVGFGRKVAVLEGAKKSDYAHVGLFPIQELRQTMKSVANFTKSNHCNLSAIQIRSASLMTNEIVLTSYGVAEERVLMTSASVPFQEPNCSPKIYKRDFYKLLLGSRGKYVSLVWGRLDDTVGSVLELSSKYVWLKCWEASLIYVINPKAKAQRLDEAQKSEAMARMLEDYMRIQRRLYQAGLRDGYVAGSRDKFDKWQLWKATGNKRGNLLVDSREKFANWVKLWEWVHMKSLPAGRQPGYLLTREGRLGFLDLLAKYPQIRERQQAYEWKLWARELLRSLHVYVREKHSLSFDFARPPAGKFQLPLNVPEWAPNEKLHNGTVKNALARLAALAL